MRYWSNAHQRPLRVFQAVGIKLDDQERLYIPDLVVAPPEALFGLSLLAPDDAKLVVEITSPRNARVDREEKRDAYAAERRATVPARRPGRCASGGHAVRRAGRWRLPARRHGAVRRVDPPARPRSTSSSTRRSSRVDRHAHRRRRSGRGRRGDRAAARRPRRGGRRQGGVPPRQVLRRRADDARPARARARSASTRRRVADWQVVDGAVLRSPSGASSRCRCRTAPGSTPPSPRGSSSTPRSSTSPSRPASTSGSATAVKSVAIDDGDRRRRRRGPRRRRRPLRRRRRRDVEPDPQGARPRRSRLPRRVARLPPVRRRRHRAGRRAS